MLASQKVRKLAEKISNFFQPSSLAALATLDHTDLVVHVPFGMRTISLFVSGADPVQDFVYHLVRFEKILRSLLVGTCGRRLSSALTTSREKGRVPQYA